MAISLKELSERISSGVPIGSIIAFRGSSIPSGWLLCDGRSCGGTALQRELGLSNTPDLRGRFIRMVGGNAAGLGGTQEDCIRNITGSVAAIDQHTSPTGAFFFQGTSNTCYAPQTSRNRIAFDASRVVPTGPENRPVNMALNYIIKANYS